MESIVIIAILLPRPLFILFFKQLYAIFVFPSKLLHGVSTETDDGHSEDFKTIEELKLSRFCVVGDVVLTRKDTKSSH